MECFNCGSELHKNDIFCINCETPVYTDDDLELMANMDFDGNEDVLQDTISMSSSDRLFSSLSLGDNDELKLEKPEEDKSSEKIVRKRNNGGRNAIIIIAAVVCAVIAGFGIYLLVRSSAGTSDEGEPPDTPPPAVNNGNGADINGNGSETPPVVIPDVGSIAILNDGRIRDEFHVSVGETVILTSKLLPEGAVGDVIWASSDTEVIEVTQTDSSGAEAKIVGVGPGVADLIVSVGDIVQEYAVYVDSLSVTMQLLNALENEDLPIWLTIMWYDGDRQGQEVVFERDLENQLWTMESAVERGDVIPTFLPEHGAITMRFPDSENVYFLFDDSTGFYGNIDQPDNEEFMWWFKTTLIEPEG